MRPQIPELEKDYFESLHIVLDTLEKCLAAKAEVNCLVKSFKLTYSFGLQITGKLLNFMKKILIELKY